MRRVLIFGSFDGLHEGHKNLCKQARALGDFLIACVASDATIRELKKHDPKYPLAERMRTLMQSAVVDGVIEGDEASHTWNVLQKVQPDTIALGYDQKELKEALEAYLATQSQKPTIVVLNAYKPEVFKSSLLNR